MGVGFFHGLWGSICSAGIWEKVVDSWVVMRRWMKVGVVRVEYAGLKALDRPIVHDSMQFRSMSTTLIKGALQDLSRLSSTLNRIGSLGRLAVTTSSPRQVGRDRIPPVHTLP